MVGGPSYQDAPFNLATNGHRQPGSSFKPFTLVTALEQGRSTGEVFTSAPQQIPFRAKVEEEQRQGREGRQRAVQGQQLRRLLPRLGVDRDRDHLLRQLRLLAARDPGGPAERRRDGARRWGSRPTSSTETQYSIADGPVRALQPGADPRRARGRRDAAGDGARLQHARRRRPAALGDDGLERRRPGRDPRRLRRRRRLDDGPSATSRATRSPTRPGPAASTRSIAKQVIDPAVAAEARSILSTVVTERHRPPGPDRRPDLGQDRDHRRQRRRLVLRRDPARSPPASGSATPTR